MELMEIRRALLDYNGRLPPIYRQVDYLYRSDSANGPYCEINMVLKTDDVVSFRVTKQKSNAEQAFAGTYTSGGSNLEVYYNTSNQLNSYATSSVRTNISMTYGTPNEIIFKMNSDYTLRYLGTYRPGRYLMDGSIYGMTVKNADNVPTHDLVPCYRLTDNEPGFYDTVTGVFYTNIAGTGTWVPGNDT